MNSHISLIQNIDALLPQTQCGLCGHRDGCLPYAQAISEGPTAKTRGLSRRPSRRRYTTGGRSTGFLR